MTRKRKRRSSVVEIGNGPARVRIYTMNRKDGYNEFTLSWKDSGRRKVRSFSCMDEARMVAQQTTVRLTNGLTNGLTTGDEATKRRSAIWKSSGTARDWPCGSASRSLLPWTNG